MMIYDYIVVGAGINGCFSAYHLSKRGFRTLLIDQFTLPHTRGSSHGQTRIIRKTHNQKFLHDLMDESYKQWETLEKESSTSLIDRVDMLNFSSPDSDYMKSVLQIFKENNNSDNDYEIYDQVQMIQKYPEITSNGKFIGCLDKQAGIIWADKTLVVLRKVAMTFGCEILDNFPVSSIVPDNTGNSVVITGGINVRTISAKGVIICAGPWTNKLLRPLNLELPLEPMKIPVFYWKISSKFLKHTFVCVENDYAIYGFPECEYPGLVKICYHGGIGIDPDSRDKEDITVIKEKLVKFISNCFPTVESKPSIEESCIYTMTPDENYIIDKHPKYANIVIGAGFSGTGFKLAPVTGEILSNLVTNVKGEYNIEPFKISRFKLDSKL